MPWTKTQDLTSLVEIYALYFDDGGYQATVPGFHFPSLGWFVWNEEENVAYPVTSHGLRHMTILGDF